MADPSVPYLPASDPQPESSQQPRTRRVRTGSRRGPSRPTTSRPDTAASSLSGVGELPEQQFFPEGSDLSEEEGKYTDDEDDDVFAFERPRTGAVPRVAFSDVPSTSYTRTATSHDPVPPPTTANSGTSADIFDADVAGPPRRQSATSQSDVPEPTGNIDVGGHLPELTYDKSNPPPFSGRENLNNGSFAFMNKLHQERAEAKGKNRLPTGKSLLSRLGRMRGSTAGTAHTDLTTTTDFSTTSLDSSPSKGGGGDDMETGSSTTELDSNGQVPAAKRMRSSSHLIPSTAGSTSGFTSESSGISRRGHSRGSYGMTEFSGDMTVPDGKTTYGDGMGGVLKDGSDNESAAVEGYDLVEEDSPFPEVRASVSNIDDPDMPALTIRAWILGMLLSILCTAANTFFHFRTPAPYLSPYLVQIVAYPIGTFLAWVTPIWSFTMPQRLGGKEVHLNPGPFNIKEHTIIVIMASVGIGPAYGLYAVVSSELWYGKHFGPWFNVLFILATQLTGFAFAGVCRRFVVWPASMIWPSVLVVATNLNTFHAEEEGFRGGMSRYKFLMLTGSCAFAYYFLPGFLFTALSYFSYACWIAPNNRVVNQLFGVSTGLGYGMLTFDWSQVTWIGNPLATPWWAEVNWLFGFVLFYWILVPILYYTNVWYTAFLPVNVIQAADRFGTSYDIFNILTPDIQLNITAYEAYSPIYLSASFNMTFMLAFALSTGLLVHTALHHGPRIYRAIINVKSEADDIHMKLMRQYPEAPDWWYIALFAVCFLFAVLAIEIFHTGLPVWGYVISIVLPFIYVLPAAFMFALTAQTVAINLLAELIPGYIFIGKPIPGMLFKTFSVQTVVEAMAFVQDQKLGHYMKLPPRSTFIAQLSACAICSLVQVGTKHLLFATVHDICGAQQEDLLTCASTKVFFTSSIIWGLIGPSRLFNKGYLYHPQVWALLIGAILPIPFWLWVRRRPRSMLRNMNVPVIINGGFSIPPATGINYSSFFIAGFIFQFWIRRRHFAWWSKYNYVLSVALDAGTAFSALFIFLVLDLPNARIDWWGNRVYQQTADWNGVGASLYDAPPTGFGPDKW